MRLRNFHLFSLPIDNTYENVFDWYLQGATNKQSSIVAYDTYLQNLYDSHDIGSITNFLYNKSVKISNGISTITLPLSYEVVRNYNYIIVNLSDNSSEYPYDGMDFQAFFITSVSSENDSTNNPSCTISIEYDVWANNLYYLTKTNEYNPNGYITEGHINRFEENDISQSYTFKTIPNCEPRSQPQFEDYIGSQNKRLVWAVYEWNVDFLRYQTNVSTPSSNTFGETLGNLPRYGQFVYTFIPWAYIQDNSFITANFNVYGRSQDGETVIAYNPSNERLFRESFSNKLNGIYLTFNVPFKVSGSYEQGFNVEKEDAFFGYINNPNNALTEVFTSIGAHFICLSREQFFDYSIVSNNRTISKNNILADDYYSEIPYLNYPYKYFYYDVQGKQFVINDGITFPSVTVKSTPFIYGTMFTVNINNGSINNVKRETFTVQSLGSIPITSSALVEHFSNNSFSSFARLLTGETNNAFDYTVQANNQKMERWDMMMLNNRAYKITNMNKYRRLGKSLMEQGASLNAISQVAIAGAQLIDYARQNYTVRNDSNFSELMLYTLDRMLLRYVDFIDNDIMKMDFQLTKANGYLYSRYDSVITSYRALFDYVKAYDFNPTIIANIEERNEIIDIINKGVRKWHINNFTHTYYSETQRKQIKALDTRVVNPEPFLIEPEEEN